MNRIQSRNIWARIPPHRAAARRRSLGRRIGDAIARTSAAALEGVEQPEPVPDFVGDGLAFVEVRFGPARNGGVEDGAAVVLWFGVLARYLKKLRRVSRGTYEEVVGAVCDRGGEVAVLRSVLIDIPGEMGDENYPQVASNGVLEVDVKSLIVSLAERLLHGQFVAIGCPAGVDGVVCARKCELD